MLRKHPVTHSASSTLHEIDFHVPEECSLDMCPSHVDPHVTGLVQQNVVLGAGTQSVAETWRWNNTDW